MDKRMIQGREVSDAQVQVRVDEAEAGYDAEELQKRWGRPPRAGSASRVVPTRFSDEELAELMAHVEREGLGHSAAIRAAMREWARAWSSLRPLVNTGSATGTRSLPCGQHWQADH